MALVTDAFGNPVPGVSVTFTAPSSSPTATFAGSSRTATATTTAAGLATAPALTADSVAGVFSVTAQAAGTGTASYSLTNNPGPASKLVFATSPTSSSPGAAFPTQPVVAITDADGNVVTTASSGVSLSITAGTGTAGAAITCAANPVAAASGVATFTGCRINLAGTGYTLRATATSLAAVTSAPFNVTVPLVPSSIALVNQAGGTRDRLEAGDRMVIAYAGTLKANTLCSTWPSDTTGYTATDGTLTLKARGAPTGSDELLVTTSTSCGGAFNLGYVDLGSVKPSGGSGTYTWNATIEWNPMTGTLTITVGAIASAQPPDVNGNISATYRPAATITDPLGTPISGTATYTGRFF